MGWVDPLQGKVVGLDTMTLIYYIEEHPIYLKIVDPFFDALELGKCRAVTSMIALLEVLVHPIREGNTKLFQRYRDILFDAEGLTTVELSQPIAEEAARLRAIYNIRTPDAIQTATASFARASFL